MSSASTLNKIGNNAKAIVDVGVVAALVLTMYVLVIAPGKLAHGREMSRVDYLAAFVGMGFWVSAAIAISGMVR